MQLNLWIPKAITENIVRWDKNSFCLFPIISRLQKLLKHISIRRLKTDQDEGKPLVKLPPRTVVIQEVELSEEERDLYDAMQNHGQLIIGR